MLDTDHTRRLLWQKQRRAELARAVEQGAVALLPTGAIEQHGPHLPLDTDIWSALTVSLGAAEQVDEFPVLVLPPIWWGLSPYWMGFPGTLTLQPETFIAVVYDVCRSVAHHGVRKLVIVNGHGGNAGVIQAAAIKASGEDLRVAALSYWDLVQEEMQRLGVRDGRSIGHAGEWETSIQLALQPGCVDLDAARPEQCTDLSGPLELVARAGAGAAYLPPEPRREAPHGVYGQALAGDRERGQALLDAAARRLAAFVRAFRAA